MARKTQDRRSGKDPLWYKRAIIYELHVRAFHDGVGDGYGDFRGLTAKLDYLHDLGISAIWLLPFYPSPLKDDGYDIADYRSIHPAYGTLGDFKTFLREAHQRGLRVITELVVNHTSDQHPWFQQSRRAKPGSRAREMYVWSDTPERYRDARIIFKDFETSNWTWDPLAKAYYWHRFFSHQPDLNFDNPQVHEEILEVVDFWFGMGVDGLRLDAVPYLYEREGTNCENLPETHEFLKELRRHVDAVYGDRLLLAEANQWPEDAVAYFGSGKGDECHMAYHFPLMPRLFMGVRMEDRVPIVDILQETPPLPETGQWALFLRNHDELTLEMVTDEERDYMYRVYAQDRRARINLGIRRRLAPLLGNDRRRIELLNALLLSLPGTPVLYYGDEIGMGENIFLGDRNGVRTPMQWSADRNAGFSRANPQSLFLPVIVDPEYHYESVNVETQERNPHSLLWWMRRVIALRKRYQAFGTGSIEFLSPENRKILAFLRTSGDEKILVVANLSRFAQPVCLDLSAHTGLVPVELFGRTSFAAIDEKPYCLTLGPHSFYWFSLEPRSKAGAVLATAGGGKAAVPVLDLSTAWRGILEDPVAKAALEGILPAYIRERRWFGGKAREIKSVAIEDSVLMGPPSREAHLAFLRVEYSQHEPDLYLLPLAFTTGTAATTLSREQPHLVIARGKEADSAEEGVIHDAVGSPEFCQLLLEAIAAQRRLKSATGTLVGSRTKAFRELAGEGEKALVPLVGKAEQSNTAVIYGDRLILKLLRRLEAGTHPELEIGRFLVAKRFPNVPPLAGALEHHRKHDVYTIGVLHGFIPQCKDAWSHTQDVLSRFFERVQSLPAAAKVPPRIEGTLEQLVGAALPAEVIERLGTYVESARLLGQRTAQMHMALASDLDDKDFAPEPFSPHYQRGLFQSMRNLTVQTLRLLRGSLKSLPADVRLHAQQVCDLEAECLRRFRTTFDGRIRGLRIRVHGDFHLGQVLYTGKDFLVIDFEGEPVRALSERRIKRSPLRDVAGMLRSFHYAAHAALRALEERGTVSPEGIAALEPWAQYWHGWTRVLYLKTYLETAGAAGFSPAGSQELWQLLGVSLLEKAIYEIAYELNHRPDWLRIPLLGVLELLGAP